MNIKAATLNVGGILDSRDTPKSQEAPALVRRRQRTIASMGNVLLPIYFSDKNLL